MKGEIILKILEVIESMVVGTADLLDVILSSSYGASYGKLDYKLSKRKRERESKTAERELKKQEKQKYYNLLFYLKKAGLVEEKHKDRKKFFILTKKGKNKLILLKNKNNEKLPKNFYEKEKNSKFTIVIFDIPEIERRKRDWLRMVLKNLDLKMIQKSVWMGKVKIPKEFLDDLFKLKLIDFVEVFEISKTGSLERLV
ncbi:MAG: CRISPR-associated endonuclease Cas2 [Patescibacteria group bacterium]